VDEGLTSRAADEGIDDIGIGDVGKLIELLGEVLNVLPEGLIGPLPVVAEILGVPWVGVGALEVANEDRMEITPIADAARLELLDPSSGRAQQKQRKVLDSEVIV
jgi:hypothetical protein